MTQIKVKYKKLVPHAFEPSYAKPGDAGMDLTAIDSYKDLDYKFIEYGTGLAIKIPEGHVGLIFPRSSISKTPHSLANSVGVIDSGYTGEVKLRMRYDETNSRDYLEYSAGDRIGQLIVIPYPNIELEEVKELPSTERADGGFGHSGQ